MLELTAPRVKMILNDRKLEITDKLLSKCYRIFTKALEGEKHLTREELAEHLEKNAIAARGQRLGHILMHAELDGLLCSGPRRGKQFTYALLEERVPKTDKVTRDEALAKLTLRYFESHGPAQLKDFSWWSGLTVNDAKAGIAMVSKLVEEIVDRKTYWHSSNSKVVGSKTPTALLLSIFDEYTIAYKDRSALSEERYMEKMLAMGNALTAVMVIDGRVMGTWKRVSNKNGVEITLNPFRNLDQREQEAVQKGAERYGKFLNLPVRLSI